MLPGVVLQDRHGRVARVGDEHRYASRDLVGQMPGETCDREVGQGTRVGPASGQDRIAQQRRRSLGSGKKGVTDHLTQASRSRPTHLSPESGPTAAR